MTGAHVHLMLTHIPIMGALFGLLILGYALFLHKQEAARIGFGLLVIAGLAAIAVYLTGESAEEVVEHLPGISEAVIERHEEAAVFGLFGAAALGVLSLTGLVVYRKGIPQWLITTTFVAALVVSGILVWTANLGGQINHPEIHSDVSIVEEG